MNNRAQMTPILVRTIADVYLMPYFNLLIHQSHCLRHIYYPPLLRLLAIEWYHQNNLITLSDSDFLTA